MKWGIISTSLILLPPGTAGTMTALRMEIWYVTHLRRVVFREAPVAHRRTHATLIPFQASQRMCLTCRIISWIMAPEQAVSWALLRDRRKECTIILQLQNR